MEVEQTNFVTHLIITVQSYYWLSKNPSVNIWSNKFQMVLINHSTLCAILGDPGADSGDEGKSKRAEKCRAKKSKERKI